MKYNISQSEEVFFKEYLKVRYNEGDCNDIMIALLVAFIRRLCSSTYPTYHQLNAVSH